MVVKRGKELGDAKKYWFFYEEVILLIRTR
jgi:hypothetical protein